MFDHRVESVGDDGDVVGGVLKVHAASHAVRARVLIGTLPGGGKGVPEHFMLKTKENRPAPSNGPEETRHGLINQACGPFMDLGNSPLSHDTILPIIGKTAPQLRALQSLSVAIDATFWAGSLRETLGYPM